MLWTHLGPAVSHVLVCGSNGCCCRNTSEDINIVVLTTKQLEQCFCTVSQESATLVLRQTNKYVWMVSFSSLKKHCMHCMLIQKRTVRNLWKNAKTTSWLIPFSLRLENSSPKTHHQFWKCKPVQEWKQNHCRNQHEKTSARLLYIRQKIKPLLFQRRCAEVPLQLWLLH